VIGPSQSTPILHVDDIAVNDTTGSMNSSWCGAGEIHLQAPAKNMFNDQTVQPSGSAIEAINDLPGPIDDANYIHTTGMGRAGWWMTEMPVAGGVTAMLWGIRGGSTVATPLSTFLDIREATGLINFASFFDLGVNGWKTIYPVARAEGVWGDVTGRMLSASTRYVSGHMIQTGRSAASANPVRVSAVWCNVDVAMPLTPTTHPSRWGQRALTELETG
jgi:hypothetical protein